MSQCIHMEHVRRIVRGALSVMLVCGLSVTAARAVSVNPLVLELESAGTKKAATFQVTNDGATTLPVQLKISRLELDEQGGQKSTPAPDAFTVLPPLATVKPGQSQKFRIQWKGAEITESQTYIVSVSQVPVKFPAAQSGMQLVVNFGIIVNVAPLNSSAALNVVATGFTKDETGVTRPQLTVHNTGKRHASLSDATITLSQGKATKTLTPANLRQLIGAGLVQPGKKRRFILGVTLPVQPGPLAARVDYQPHTTAATSN
jgi:fimbrial chaperone protein